MCSCSLTTAFLTWSPSWQPPCRTPPAALPADRAHIPCRPAGPRSTCQPPASTTGGMLTGSPGPPHSWPHVTHPASRVILPENQLEETTTAAPANSSLPRRHLCPSIHPRRLSGECPSIPAASVERALTASKCTRSRCPEDHPCPGRTPRALRELRCAAKALPVQCSKSRPQFKSARNHLNKWFLFGS